MISFGGARAVPTACRLGTEVKTKRVKMGCFFGGLGLWWFDFHRERDQFGGEVNQEVELSKNASFKGVLDMDGERGRES